MMRSPLVFSGLHSFIFPTLILCDKSLIPSLSLWPCAGLAIVSPCLSCSWEPMDVHSTPNVPYQSWADGRDLLAMFCLKQEFLLDEEYWKGAGWVNFPINTFNVRKKWKAAKLFLFWALRFSQRICSLKYYMVCRYYGSFIHHKTKQNNSNICIWFNWVFDLLFLLERWRW